MSTFYYLTPAEAVAAAREGAPEHERITGLKGADADLFMRPQERTRAGYLHKPADPARAHAYLHWFREIRNVVRTGGDADPGTVTVTYADGSSVYLHKGDLLCVERPV